MDICSVPQLEHASVNCTGGGEESICSVSCHRGFTLTVLSGKGHPPKQVSIYTGGKFMTRCSYLAVVLAC